MTRVGGKHKIRKFFMSHVLDLSTFACLTINLKEPTMHNENKFGRTPNNWPTFDLDLLKVRRAARSSGRMPMPPSPACDAEEEMKDWTCDIYRHAIT
jgi:hypothetical protein